MTKKKTFKNPSSVINSFDPEHVWLVNGFRQSSNYFTHHEWDMEVTFTKKSEQFKVGERVRIKNTALTYVFTVLAQWKGSVVVVDENDDLVQICESDELVRI